MFQFRGFPSYGYVFTIRCMTVNHADCSIRKSAHHSLLTAPRSLSQLTTSFFGSQCQGILHTLLLALPFVSERICVCRIFLPDYLKKTCFFIDCRSSSRSFKYFSFLFSFQDALLRILFLKYPQNWTMSNPWTNLRMMLSRAFLLRKEVIQPHLPIRLPCYDFTPVINPTFDSVLLAVGLLASGVTDSHGVTGGVYKARERIHRSMLICDY